MTIGLVLGGKALGFFEEEFFTLYILGGGASLILGLYLVASAETE